MASQAPTQPTNTQQQPNFGMQQPYGGHSQGHTQPSYHQQPLGVTQPQYPMPPQQQSYVKPQEPYNPNFGSNVPTYPPQMGYQTNGAPAPYPDGPPPPYPGLPNQ